MAEYKLEVTTGNMTNAGTFDYIYATLIGSEGKSERTNLDDYGRDFGTGTVRWVLTVIIFMYILKGFDILISNNSKDICHYES